MSFLGGRLASAERKYFREESEVKASALRKKRQPERGGKQIQQEQQNEESLCDVLPEVLMHSAPLGLRDSQSPLGGKEGTDEKQQMQMPLGFAAADTGPRDSAQVLGPMRQRHLLHRSLVEVPQTRLGPAKYNLAFPTATPKSSVSTANERRQVEAVGAAAARSRAQQAAAASEAFFMVSKAFGVATILVYGGAVLGVGLGMRALGINQVQDIPEKGREFMEPRVAAIRASFEPFKETVNGMAQRWRMSEEQQKSVGQKYAEVLRGPDRTPEGSS